MHTKVLYARWLYCQVVYVCVLGFSATTAMAPEDTFEEDMFAEAALHWRSSPEDVSDDEDAAVVPHVLGSSVNQREQGMAMNKKRKFGDLKETKLTVMKERKKARTNNNLVTIPHDPCKRTCKVVFIRKPGDGSMQAVPMWPQYQYNGIDGAFIHVAQSEEWLIMILEALRSRKQGAQKDKVHTMRECHRKVHFVMLALLKEALSRSSKAGGHVLLTCVRTYVRRHVRTYVRTTYSRACTCVPRKVLSVKIESTYVRTYVRTCLRPHMPRTHVMTPHVFVYVRALCQHAHT